MMLSLLLALSVTAGAPQDTPLEMMTYQIVLLKKGPSAPPSSPADQKKMQDEHLANLAELNRQRINLVYGPILVDGDIRGIAVLAVADADAAKARFANDPFVKAGVSNPANLEPLIFGLLVRGANTTQDSAAAAEIQKGHLAYMESLNKQGKLVMAGPFADQGRARGVVVYRVKDLAEAQALAAEDPAVKAGRLALEAYPWMTFKGILK